MKTAMDYVKERDERVDVAGKMARLKEWCERFFDDKSWSVANDGMLQTLEPFHSNSAVWIEIVLSPEDARYEIQWDGGREEPEELTAARSWAAENIEEFKDKIEKMWEHALQKAPPIPQIYYSSRIPVHPVADIA